MASEIGSIDTDNSAFVFVKLSGGGGVQCLLDTGFNRELFLPRRLAEVLNLQITGEEEFVVAGGSIFPAFTSLVEIDWLGHSRIAEAILHEGTDQLVGTALLSGTRLTIDYIKRSVEIESLLFG